MANAILRLNEGDATVNLYEPRLSGGTGATVVTVSGGLGAIANVGSGETLYVLGHGSPTDLGGYTAAQLAKLLSDAGLKSGCSIVLVACNSGSGGAPFALELKVQLVSLKILPTSVSGGTDTMYVTNTGAPTTFWSKPDGTWGHSTASTSTVNTPWGTRTVQSNPTYKTS
jgi:hypothetical protein